MTEAEINRTIAEYCGVETSNRDIYYCDICKKEVDANHGFEHSVWITRVKVPNYCNDLNAMHEAEEVLLKLPDSIENDAARKRYRLNLENMCRNAGWHYAYHATAAQRAEAFLRTIGKFPNLNQT